MMNTDIRGLGNREALTEIAKMAYGSGLFEKESGGNGNIGILNGRVVKFNTHRNERGGDFNFDMLASSNDLRMKLSEIAESFVSANSNADEKTRTKLSQMLQSVREKLGMNATGNEITARNLLERKVVAKVINDISRATGFNAWDALRENDMSAFSSKNIDTTFATVKTNLENADYTEWNDFQGVFYKEFNKAVDELANPQDNKAGVQLGDKEREFLKDLIERDIENCRDEGRPLPDAQELCDSIRNFTSKYLTVTLHAFNLNSAHLENDRTEIGKWNQGAVYVGGATDEKTRQDRADLELSLIANAPKKALFYTGMALSFMSEMLEDMRDRQPTGRLTGETVWRCCFGKKSPLPEGKAGVLGTEEFTVAFIEKTKEAIKAVAKECGSPDKQNVDVDMLLGTGMVNLFNIGMSFVSAVHRAVGSDYQEIKFLAKDQIYNPIDANLKTDDQIFSQLKYDLFRSQPLVRFADSNDDALDVFDFEELFENKGSAEIDDNDIWNLMKQVDTGYGKGQIAPKQRNVILMSLTQAGSSLFKILLGNNGEHISCQINVRKEDDDSVTMTWSSKPGSAYDISYSYRIEPDGNNYPIGELICKENIGY